MPNFSYCADGTKLTDSAIKTRLSKAYREKYEGNPHPCCEETGLPAQGSSHIVSKKRCKELHRTELIWAHDNFFPATHEVNLRWEANDSTLRNYWQYMEIVKKYDPEGYQKRLMKL